MPQQRQSCFVPECCSCLLPLNAGRYREPLVQRPVTETVLLTRPVLSRLSSHGRACAEGKTGQGTRLAASLQRFHADTHSAPLLSPGFSPC